MNDNILKLERVNKHSPLMKASMPKEIFAEVKGWVKECRKIKDHPLAELKSHPNVGYNYNGSGVKHNTYQCSVPSRLVEESFWLIWVLKLVAKYYGKGKKYRYYRIRNHHFGLSYDDEYGIWINFTYEGDDNPIHNHAGFLSGIMYVQNDGQPTIFPDYNTITDAKVGTMYLWPSNGNHYIEEKKTKEERITISFNIAELRPDHPSAVEFTT